MFDLVAAAPPDPILGLSEAFNKDPRAEKINLTIGVYRDDSGKTPILNSVKRAEERLLSSEDTKGYLGIDGLLAFNQLTQGLTLAGVADEERIVALQTPGGTGALRVAADFAGTVFPGNRIWLSTPTWPNHTAIFQQSGLQCVAYPYLGEDRKSLDFPAMMEAIDAGGRPGDLICVHACCHNPTGVDPDADQWKEIAALTAEKGMLPLVDFAYHGFGLGLEQDRTAIDTLAAHHSEMLVCSSYSKNFGLYSERVGALFAICSDSKSAGSVQSQLKSTVRCNYSNPPRHGGAIVATILADAELRKEWEIELDGMRDRIQSTREMFVKATQSAGAATDFSFLLEQRGMFSFSGLNPMQVDWLKSERGIYIVGSGRINVAGITSANVQYLAESIADCLTAS